MKKLLFIVSIVIFYSFSFKENKSYVPNSETAIKIAEAVWLPIYGNGIYDKTPFIAELEGDSIWHVYGTLTQPKDYIDKNGDTVITLREGGVPEFFLYKSDGRIIQVSHGK